MSSIKIYSKKMAGANILQSCLKLFIIITAIFNISFMLHGRKATGRLHVEPLWDNSSVGVYECFLNTTEGTIYFGGSPYYTCRIQVRAEQGVQVLLQIPGRNHCTEPSFLYVERIGVMERCPNKYVAFWEENEPCSSVFVHRNLEIVLTGNISVFISGVSAIETLPPCPEFQQNVTEMEAICQLSYCKNVREYNEKFTCQADFSFDYCRIATILNPYEVEFYCNNATVSYTYKAMIDYTENIVKLD